MPSPFVPLDPQKQLITAFSFSISFMNSHQWLFFPNTLKPFRNKALLDAQRHFPYPINQAASLSPRDEELNLGEIFAWVIIRSSFSVLKKSK